MQLLVPHAAVGRVAVLREPLAVIADDHHRGAVPVGAIGERREDAAELLGIAESTLELANEYAKRREQFGRTIGSFQSIKHMLADMFVRQEVARAAVYAAGATLDDPTVGEASRAVSAAKITAGEAAMKNARACIQIHGGMGYTWEMPPHYYLKRTWVLENAFGTVDEHAEGVAARIEAAALRTITNC